MLALSTSLLGLRSEALYDRQAKKRVLLYFEVKTSSVAAGFGRHSMPSLVCNPDLLILKLLCESHLSLGTLISNLGTLVLWVLELFAMCATDRQTDRQTDKSNAYCLLTYGRRHNNLPGNNISTVFYVSKVAVQR